MVFTDGSEKSEKNRWGFIVKNKATGDTLTKQSRTITGTAQKAELMAVLEALLHCIGSNLKRIEIVTDSYYCAQDMASDKKIWQNNGYRGAKNKPIQYEGEWRKIHELMDKMDIVVSH